MKHKTWPAIVWGGLIAGACDLTYALVFYGAQKVPPGRIPQSIASGLLGVASFKGGWQTIILGVILQFTIALGAASLYYIASRRVSFLNRHAGICGVLYGVAIYFFMNWVVVPLSAAPKFKTTTVSQLSDFAVHMFLIGLPIALIVRHYSRRALPH